MDPVAAILKANLHSQPRHTLHPHHSQKAVVSLNQRNRLHRNICHILTSLTQRPIRHSSRRQRIHHLHFSGLAKQQFWKRCLIRLGTWLEYICCFGESTRILGNDLELAWKVRGLVGRVLMVGCYYLGPEVLGTGFVMFWDWEFWTDY